MNPTAPPPPARARLAESFEDSPGAWPPTAAGVGWPRRWPSDQPDHRGAPLHRPKNSLAGHPSKRGGQQAPPPTPQQQPTPVRLRNTPAGKGKSPRPPTPKPEQPPTPGAGKAPGLPAPAPAGTLPTNRTPRRRLRPTGRQPAMRRRPAAATSEKSGFCPGRLGTPVLLRLCNNRPAHPGERSPLTCPAPVA